MKETIKEKCIIIRNENNLLLKKLDIEKEKEFVIEFKKVKQDKKGKNLKLLINPFNKKQISCLLFYFINKDYNKENKKYIKLSFLQRFALNCRIESIFKDEYILHDYYIEKYRNSINGYVNVDYSKR